MAGALFSSTTALLLAAGGAVVGWRRGVFELGRERAARGRLARDALPEMLDVVCLGMRSGLTFDLSFGLYAESFEGPFASECRRAHQRWSLGMATREVALHALGQSFDYPPLAQAVESIERSIRLGTSAVERLEKAAAASRERQRIEVEEEVSKAPVRMMVPTGALILPAMLLLVMGPMLLELMQGS
ncbi:hypothetical protein HLV35_02070 [Eggerthellaceae bacterium zg-997]|nr:hypothetical protein [Eggerthellaceae bacterium zg-997]